MIEQRRGMDFIEKLSLILVGGAFVGGFIVLLDVKLILTIWGQTVMVGKDGFAPEVKGMVLQSMLISGFAAVVAYWLGTTKQGQDQAVSVSKIAEAAAPTTALAVAASRSDPAPAPPAAEPIKTEPIKAETVQVNADSAVVNAPKPDEPKGGAP